MRSPRMLEHLPKTLSFAGVGAVLALGSPAGLLLLRSIAAHQWPSLHFVGTQIKSDPLLYAYLTFATMFMFVFLGRLLGAREDALAQTSITDPLTRLHNRRHLYARLEEELARFARHQVPFALLLIDVDHLKTINDRGGHDAGDRALVIVGEVLKKTCRSTDVPARYGGDEFVVLLPATTGTQALGLCERIRNTVHEGTWNLPLPLTVSIGVVEAQIGTTTAKDLLDAADGALYAAKKAGRDQAMVATEETRNSMLNVS